ncbi:hypothetical protein [Thalassotalea sp. Y01]|uniref:hypothetical protein n=1 Tax=Thalassotalea sp. Y01 TaxID=2729613 RepID=UPI00145EC388|nr:hypothetical protein [Thalassotalea sp. Y01]NMP17868.1 hypothetical protein [Thalassotalea sp. Y01]
MNQAILFNDDFQYIDAQNCWCFTGMLSGARITIYIQAPKRDITDALKFELEELIEDYLEDEEPDEDNIIRLTI